MTEAKQYLGVRDTMPGKPHQAFKRPQKPKCQTPKAKVQTWLNSRGLTDETLAAFKIGEQLRDKARRLRQEVKLGEYAMEDDTASPGHGPQLEQDRAASGPDLDQELT